MSHYRWQGTSCHRTSLTQAAIIRIKTVCVFQINVCFSFCRIILCARRKWTWKKSTSHCIYSLWFCAILIYSWVSLSLNKMLCCTKHYSLCMCKSECEFNLSPLYSAVIYHPSCWAQTQRKWSVSATGREEGGRSDPQHVNLDLFYESRPPCKMKCSCCERKQWSATHVITLTPWRGRLGSILRPWLPCALLASNSTNLQIFKVVFIFSQAPLPCSRSITICCLPPSSGPPKTVTFNIFKSSAQLLSTKTLSQTINRGPRWSCQSSCLWRITSYHKKLLLYPVWMIWTLEQVLKHLPNQWIVIWSQTLQCKWMLVGYGMQLLNSLRGELSLPETMLKMSYPYLGINGLTTHYTNAKKKKVKHLMYVSSFCFC